ncbi:MAG: hypothetical protein RLZZ450_2885 [Pseudomonadota bacterium]
MARVAPPLGALFAGALTLWPDDPRWLALSGLLGLMVLCEMLRRVQASVWRAAVVGLAFGTAANATALSSLVPLLSRFVRLPWPEASALALLLWLVQSAPFALAAAANQRLLLRAYPPWLSLPLCLVPALALVPQLFPWHLAATQVGFLPFVQLAELGGESLLGLCLVATASALHAAVRTRGPARALVLAVAALSYGVPVVYGALRIPAIERLRASAETLRVGVVQSNVGLTEKHDGQHTRAILAGLRALTRELEQRGAELTVWGETAYPYPLPRSFTHAPSDDRRVLGDGVRGPILLGLETYTNFDPRSPKYNSAWLLRQDGRLRDRVDKARLLAFAEFVPLWSVLPPLRARFRTRGFHAGAPGTVALAQGKLGVLICYEDLFASAARATVRLGARALINLTNDAWFGDTREPHLHDLLARLRAVELRRDLVRTVNTGISSFTSASGERLFATESYRRTSFVAAVKLLDEQTPYARWGDWVTPCCLLGLLFCVRDTWLSRSTFLRRRR